MNRTSINNWWESFVILNPKLVLSLYIYEMIMMPNFPSNSQLSGKMMNKLKYFYNFQICHEYRGQLSLLSSYVPFIFSSIFLHLLYQIFFILFLNDLFFDLNLIFHIHYFRQDFIKLFHLFHIQYRLNIILT